MARSRSSNNSDNLSSLHQELSSEVTKLVRWEVKADLSRMDTETQLEQTEQTILHQEEVIRQLQQEQDQLRAINTAARNRK